MGLQQIALLGPMYMLHDTMNSVRYLDMQQTFVWPEVLAWNNSNEVIFMQDGATPHYALIVREWFQENFPDKWIGRDGLHHWPA